MSWYLNTNKYFSSISNLPTIANDGDVAYVPQFIGDEYFRMCYNSIASKWVVDVGQCVINAHDIFTVSNTPTTNSIFYTFPFSTNILLPNQIWECVSLATGTFGAVTCGYRSLFGGTTTNSSKAVLSQTTPRAKERKVFARRTSGNVDVVEYNGGVGVTIDNYFNDNEFPKITFEPGQIGDSFVLNHYSLRRIG